MLIWLKNWFLNKNFISKKVITSYDYAAPISEEGQITPLYKAIRDWIGTKHEWSNPPLPLPPNRTYILFVMRKDERVCKFKRQKK